MRPFEDLADQIAMQEAVPSIAAQALLDTENGARDPNLFLSESWGGGSMGLTMITLRTARSLGFKGSQNDLLAPETNIRYGLRYLRQMFDQVGKGDWSLAYAGYNAGPDLSPFPTVAVSHFVANLARWKAIREGQAKGGATSTGGFQMPPGPGITGWGLLAALGAGLVLLLSTMKRGRR
jgi:hypothetical protein